MSELPVASPLRHRQIRLCELSVFNWGSFHGLHTAPIDPHGTLITGDNGAGKSTLIDGLIALLLPSGKATFNAAAAQGDKTDRSIMAYIRGSYGSERDGVRTRVQSKREGATVSALRAHYRAEDGADFTLAALWWLSNASSALADLNRLFFVTRRDLTLEELLEVFGRGQARAVKQRYRGEVFETFADYEETYRRTLSIENANAPALLARALGLKKIDDLTALIREFVLEPSTVWDAARNAVREFADLVATHRELLDARRQREFLAPLPALHREFLAAEAKCGELGDQKAALPVYLAEQQERLWRARVQVIGAEVEAIELALDQLTRAEADAATHVESRHAEYIQAGGGRIEDLKKDIERARERLEEVTGAASRYQKTARALGLDDRLLEATFRANLGAAHDAKQKVGAQREAAQDGFGAAARDYSEAQHQLKASQAELTEVERRPDSAIDSKFQRLRDQMAEMLGFAEQELMFIGELIDVKEEEREWQGAIERALGGLRVTLAVPEDRSHLINGWLNDHHTGLHVRSQAVRDAKVSPRFKDNGFLRKLEWRPHPYREWLKQHLARFDLACVPKSEFDATAFSVTRAGLVQHELGRVEKRDLKRIDDRSDWCLGFSNARRVALLQGQVRQQQAEFERRQVELNAARATLDSTEQQRKHWQDLLEVDWERIDLARAHHTLKEHQQGLEALESSQGDLAQAKRRWDAAKVRAEQVKTQLQNHREERGRVVGRLEHAQKNLGQAHQMAASGMPDAMREPLTHLIGEVTDQQLDEIDQLQVHWRSQLEGALAKASAQREQAGRKAVGIMSAYRTQQEWKAVTAEWGSELRDLPTYLERLEHIEREGLPTLVENFRERLNRHTTHSLAGIRSQINNELDDIRERIETINEVLARTEFRQGTHLRLKAELAEYEHIRDFNRQLQAVMQAATSEDHEARFEGLRSVVAILEKATSPASAYTKESQRLLDPRYRLAFLAEDVDTATGQVLDVLASSSGKSGGEKEAFAGTVVAASLAYVLTSEGADRPTYCTVFLDEAFSNTAEAVSRRVLRVFRELNIHVNLITPFKNLNLARESARSLLIAERDQHRHESRLCQVTWEEIDRRLAERARSRPQNTAIVIAAE